VLTTIPFSIRQLTLAELYYGSYKSSAPLKHIEEISKVKERFEVISISSSLNNFGQLKADMERTGNKIDYFDLLIGATAITHDLIMVTDNVKHLGKIPRIQLENWIERA
jgi:tRNA(fMet)-specific endonuclease VapC